MILWIMDDHQIFYLGMETSDFDIAETRKLRQVSDRLDTVQAIRQSEKVF